MKGRIVVLSPWPI